MTTRTETTKRDSIKMALIITGVSIAVYSAVVLIFGLINSITPITTTGSSGNFLIILTAKAITVSDDIAVDDDEQFSLPDFNTGNSNNKVVLRTATTTAGEEDENTDSLVPVPYSTFCVDRKTDSTFEWCENIDVKNNIAWCDFEVYDCIGEDYIQASQKEDGTLYYPADLPIQPTYERQINEDGR
jgi:hypothetical protein